MPTSFGQREVSLPKDLVRKVVLTIPRLVRDQANKTIDLFLQRIRKYASTMGETSSAGPEAGVAAGNGARMGTTQDSSWSGWAISSFTNKLTSAKGQIQVPSKNGSAAAEPGRSSSVPPKTPTSESLSVSKATQQTAPSMARAASDAQLPTDSSAVNDDIDDSWGADAWDDDQSESKKEDTFFDATSSRTSTPASTTPAAVPYDDGGEPDFAGWLAAQAKAKSKKPLPKGLGKSTSSTSKDLPTRSASATSSTKASKPAKVIDIRPKDEGDEDGWGEEW